MPPDYKPLRADKVRYIVIHCAATKPSMDIGAAEIDQWHRRQGWNEIGYHRVIRRDGRIEHGRPFTVPGAHVRGHNGHSVGICLVGGVKESDGKTPENNFTEEQFITLRVLVRQVKLMFPKAEVVGHRNLDPKKACPSFDVVDYFEKNPLI